MTIYDTIGDSISVVKEYEMTVVIRYLEDLKTELVKDTKYLNGKISIIGIEYLLQKEKNKLNDSRLGIVPSRN